MFESPFTLLGVMAAMLVADVLVTWYLVKGQGSVGSAFDPVDGTDADVVARDAMSRMLDGGYAMGEVTFRPSNCDV